MHVVRLYVLSDLHLERQRFTPVPVDADVVILAGDIAVGEDGVEWARQWADGRPVLYVVGNHEFYGHAVDALIEDLRRSAAGSSIHVLENDELVIDGVRFLGCTLWSDFDFDGPEHRTQSMLLAQRVVADYGRIKFGSGGGRLTPDDTRQLHLVSRGWLEERLADGHPGPTVVVTHHAPLIRSRPSSPALRALAGAFASDVTELMSGERVSLWIFGHTHRVADLEMRGTRVVSNPRGYPHQPVAGFDPGRVIEVDGGEARP
jgi:3',5'-cyclic AMP phosphodiesterase CpdA